MNSQLTYLMVQTRYTEFALRAEQDQLANQARRAHAASSPRWNIGRLLAAHPLKAVHAAAAVRQANPRSPEECLRCDR